MIVVLGMIKGRSRCLGKPGMDRVHHDKLARIGTTPAVGRYFILTLTIRVVLSFCYSIMSLVTVSVLLAHCRICFRDLFPCQ